MRCAHSRHEIKRRCAAETFRANAGVDVAEAIVALGVGEALVSCLGEGGIPMPVERAKVRPPRSRMGTITPEERALSMQRSPFAGRYEQALDRESAYEILTKKAQDAEVSARADAEAAAQAKADTANAKAQAAAEKAANKRPVREPDSFWESAAKSAARAASSTIGRKVGNELLRGLLGSFTKSR